MQPDPLPQQAAHGNRPLLGALLALLAIASLIILRPFLAPIGWAVILAYLSWPAYRPLRQLLDRHRSAAAVLMTLVVCSAVLVPIAWLVLMIQDELLGAYHEVTGPLWQDPDALARRLRAIPWIDEGWRARLQQYAADPGSLYGEILRGAQLWTRELTGLIGALARNLGKLLITVLTLFFLYRDGHILLAQGRRLVRRFFVDRLDRYLTAAGSMVRAVIFGTLVTALAQGMIAGVGYRIFGLQAAALMGALTGALSVIPMIGTATVWLPAAAWLFLHNEPWRGAGLIAWGFLLVHPTDNILRPLLISSASRVPFLIILLGALGGVAAFGLVGSVAGPVLLGIAVVVWREWTVEGPPGTD